MSEDSYHDPMKNPQVEYTIYDPEDTVWDPETYCQVEDVLPDMHYLMVEDVGVSVCVPKSLRYA